MSFDSLDHLELKPRQSLPFRLLRAEKPRGVIQICHGLAEHSGRYGHFAESLAEVGYHVIAHDHRGHGNNIGRHAALGSFGFRQGDELVLADVHAINRHAARQFAHLPIILFGHSMGGIVALAFALRFPQCVQALSVWNAQLVTRPMATMALALLAVERMLKGSDVPSRLFERLTFEQWAETIADRKTNADWLSHDADQVAAYLADAKCGFSPTIGLWMDLFRLLKFCADDRNYQALSPSLPINLAGGGEDPSTNNGETVRIFAKRLGRLGFSNLRSTIFPTARHESLNEVNQAEVIQFYQNWLGDVVPSLNSAR